ncbi:hypothetical protein BSM4216_3269 [Bacillus smithii]|nr:hypothetical protein BSM4216_3269 [Bacillus smithii]
MENTYLDGTENGRTYIWVKADWESKITADIVRGKGKQHEPACFFQLIGIGDPRFKRTKKDADTYLSASSKFLIWTESKCPFIYLSK